jgi:hypothetical protein
VRVPANDKRPEFAEKDTKMYTVKRFNKDDVLTSTVTSKGTIKQVATRRTYAVMNGNKVLAIPHWHTGKPTLQIFPLKKTAQKQADYLNTKGESKHGISTNQDKFGNGREFD